MEDETQVSRSQDHGKASFLRSCSKGHQIPVGEPRGPECSGQDAAPWQLPHGLEPAVSASSVMVQCRPALGVLPSGYPGAVSLAHHMSQTAPPVELQEDMNTYGLATGTWAPAHWSSNRGLGYRDLECVLSPPLSNVF